MPIKDPITAASMGRKGGKGRLQTMTAAERSERARQAARARWDTPERLANKARVDPATGLADTTAKPAEHKAQCSMF
jgi:hypothetical protein